MAFDLLSQLVCRPVIDDDEDEGSPVDDVDEEIGEESDVECDGEGNNNLDDDTYEDLNSELDLGPDDSIGSGLEWIECSCNSYTSWVKRQFGVCQMKSEANRYPKAKDTYLNWKFPEPRN
ncbi:hypothetical protein PoB_007668100 [Plakobranchus ocellatus]|uniref:Uncharacterized protein n=1 Tax=Plakobranchus ocellatus TaxID=259542 RepID=A0AAV4E262_9GAST|nr:hypothetical protein PoB_007668100 [Plakobranchus ocellatus]